MGPASGQREEPDMDFAPTDRSKDTRDSKEENIKDECRIGEPGQARVTLSVVRLETLVNKTSKVTFRRELLKRHLQGRMSCFRQWLFLKSRGKVQGGPHRNWEVPHQLLHRAQAQLKLQPFIYP